jgi:hypothetical protein
MGNAFRNILRASYFDENGYLSSVKMRENIDETYNEGIEAARARGRVGGRPKKG